ncbi:hypothetical protein [Mucilaginibacter arboris]|uniref:Periplasmic heavy metal sensor n=1 Tax=Mucilaginibacter arboris TaxID=2682090 RepID=A0A7K1SYK8_9SPHI|nr:hypothetical protein [Mucilaginibacter arboris]MVN22405.1 hypothetical protein [Mucilaginibacter arboris]
MKKLLLMLCFVAGITSLSKAQGGGRQRMSPADQAKQMQTRLKLNDDQTTKITSILQMQATKMDSIRTAANGDRQAMMQGMMSVRQMTTPKIKAVLTADQATAYDKMLADQQAQMRARMQNGGGGGNGGGAGAPPSPQK